MVQFFSGTHHLLIHVKEVLVTKKKINKVAVGYKEKN
jgi:hypothetical protein